LPSFALFTTLAREGKMRAERGQWQQHMKHSRMAKRGHKEGKKRAKPETVRMPRNQCGMTCILGLGNI